LKKIRCARCSVVNLEGFVSYPYCAACGALLATDTEETLPLWRRPIRTAVWASLLGVAILVLAIIAANGLRHDVENEAGIIVLTPREAQVRAGEPFMIQLRVEAMDPAGHYSEEPLRGVRLRIVRKTLQRFQLVQLMPQPDQEYIVGPARYFTYEKLERGTNVTLVLRALRLGRQQFAARLYSDNQTSDAIEVDIRVRAAPPMPEMNPLPGMRLAPEMR